MEGKKKKKSLFRFSLECFAFSFKQIVENKLTWKLAFRNPSFLTNTKNEKKKMVVNFSLRIRVLWGLTEVK